MLNSRLGLLGQCQNKELGIPSATLVDPPVWDWVSVAFLGLGGAVPGRGKSCGSVVRNLLGMHCRGARLSAGLPSGLVLPRPHTGLDGFSSPGFACKTCVHLGWGAWSQAQSRVGACSSLGSWCLLCACASTKVGSGEVLLRVTQRQGSAWVVVGKPRVSQVPAEPSQASALPGYRPPGQFLTLRRGAEGLMVSQCRTVDQMHPAGLFVGVGGGLSQERTLPQIGLSSF